ncbi:MAG: NAD(P)H-hydrate epimerase [Elusimicrobiales bacterium]|nr:NAD(P)H-hydrate epimerase [Elusimicrobiales bacterium]
MKIPQIKFYNGYPVVTSQKMKYIDKIAVLDYGISDETLMENAGSESAKEIISYIENNLNKKLNETKICVLCGRGNNGGDGLVCARYLKNRDLLVDVFIVSPSDKGYGKLVVDNLEKLKKASVSINLVDSENIKDVEKKIFNADIIVDALLGIGSVGKPSGVVKKLIQIANKTKKDIISLDIPSGLNPDTGHHTGVFIVAKMTLTFGFPKSGLMAPHAQKNIGVLKVIDIGYPKQLIEKVSKENNS